MAAFLGSVVGSVLKGVSNMNGLDLSEPKNAFGVYNWAKTYSYMKRMRNDSEEKLALVGRKMKRQGINPQFKLFGIDTFEKVVDYFPSLVKASQPGIGLSTIPDRNVPVYFEYKENEKEKWKRKKEEEANAKEANAKEANASRANASRANAKPDNTKVNANSPKEANVKPNDVTNDAKGAIAKEANASVVTNGTKVQRANSKGGGVNAKEANANANVKDKNAKTFADGANATRANANVTKNSNMLRMMAKAAKLKRLKCGTKMRRIRLHKQLLWYIEMKHADDAEIESARAAIRNSIGKKAAPLNKDDAIEFNPLSREMIDVPPRHSENIYADYEVFFLPQDFALTVGKTEYNVPYLMMLIRDPITGAKPPTNDKNAKTSSVSTGLDVATTGLHAVGLGAQMFVGGAMEYEEFPYIINVDVNKDYSYNFKFAPHKSKFEEEATLAFHQLFNTVKRDDPDKTKWLGDSYTVYDDANIVSLDDLLMEGVEAINVEKVKRVAQGLVDKEDKDNVWKCADAIATVIKQIAKDVLKVKDKGKDKVVFGGLRMKLLTYAQMLKFGKPVGVTFNKEGNDYVANVSRTGSIVDVPDDDCVSEDEDELDVKKIQNGLEQFSNVMNRHSYYKDDNDNEDKKSAKKVDTTPPTKEELMEIHNMLTTELGVITEFDLLNRMMDYKKKDLTGFYKPSKFGKRLRKHLDEFESIVYRIKTIVWKLEHVRDKDELKTLALIILKATPGYEDRKVYDEELLKTLIDNLNDEYDDEVDDENIKKAIGSINKAQIYIRYIFPLLDDKTEYLDNDETIVQYIDNEPIYDTVSRPPSFQAVKDLLIKRMNQIIVRLKPNVAANANANQKDKPVELQNVKINVSGQSAQSSQQVQKQNTKHPDNTKAASNVQQAKANTKGANAKGANAKGANASRNACVTKDGKDPIKYHFDFEYIEDLQINNKITKGSLGFYEYEFVVNKGNKRRFICPVTIPEDIEKIVLYMPKRYEAICEVRWIHGYYESETDGVKNQTQIKMMSEDIMKIYAAPQGNANANNVVIVNANANAQAKKPQQSNGNVKKRPKTNAAMNVVKTPNASGKNRNVAHPPFPLEYQLKTIGKDNIFYVFEDEKNATKQFKTQFEMRYPDVPLPVLLLRRNKKDWDFIVSIDPGNGKCMGKKTYFKGQLTEKELPTGTVIKTVIVDIPRDIEDVCKSKMENIAIRINTNNNNVKELKLKKTEGISKSLFKALDNTAKMIKDYTKKKVDDLYKTREQRDRNSQSSQSYKDTIHVYSKKHIGFFLFPKGDKHGRLLVIHEIYGLKLVLDIDNGYRIIKDESIKDDIRNVITSVEVIDEERRKEIAKMLGVQYKETENVKRKKQNQNPDKITFSVYKEGDPPYTSGRVDYEVVIVKPGINWNEVDLLLKRDPKSTDIRKTMEDTTVYINKMIGAFDTAVKLNADFADLFVKPKKYLEDARQLVIVEFDEKGDVVGKNPFEADTNVDLKLNRDEDNNKLVLNMTIERGGKKCKVERFISVAEVSKVKRVKVLLQKNLSEKLCPPSYTPKLIIDWEPIFVNVKAAKVNVQRQGQQGQVQRQPQVQQSAGGEKVCVMGRLRKVVKERRRQMVMYRGELVPLSLLRDLEKGMKKTKK